jgi:DNA (cytosine-5)-methyltransferase 1
VRYGSVCSGVEAATVAWHPLGWKPQWFSEIEQFPSDVLQHHYPDVPNLGDMTKFKEWPHDQSIELLVGGTPCQSFSVAGLRKGLSDPRGNLMLTYLAIAARYSPRWLVWENVPGVLSSNQGRDFGTFLWALGELGYGFAYRTLDAQYFGVAQRRRRVFVVGYFGDWRRAAAVLFERESLQGNPPPSREKREDVAPTVTQGAPFSRTGNERIETQALITARMRGFGDYDCDGTASTVKARDYKNATDLIESTTSYSIRDDVTPKTAKEIIGTLSARDYKGVQAVAFGAQNSASQGDSVSEHVTPTLDKSKTPGVMTNMQVRRLTPKETERLQGFPDDYTRIPYRNKDAKDCPDGVRYKAMGNSMAVPVMRWIGERINMVESIQVSDTMEAT